MYPFSNDIIAQITWREDDVAALFREHEVDIRLLNDFVQTQHVTKTLQDLSIQHGWEVLETLLNDYTHFEIEH